MFHWLIVLSEMRKKTLLVILKETWEIAVCRLIKVRRFFNPALLKCFLPSPTPWNYFTNFIKNDSSIVVCAFPVEKRSISTIFQTIIIIFLSIITLQSKAQTTPPENDNINQQQLENAAEDAPDNADLSELVDTRNYFINHQINLNNTNRDELSQLELLNDLQIEAILLTVLNFHLP